MEPFRCYVTQWGCQISQKSVTMVYSSMLLSSISISSRSIDKEAFRDDIAASELAAISPIVAVTGDATELFDKYNAVVSAIVDKHAPLQSGRVAVRPLVPWFSDALADAKRERRRMERKWRHTPLQINRDIYKTQCAHVKHMIKAAKSDYFVSELEQCKGDTRRLYRLLNGLLQRGKSSSPPSNKDPQLLASRFAQAFNTKVETIRLTLGDQSMSCYSSDYQPCSSVPLLHTFPTTSVSDTCQLIIKSPSTTCALDPVPTWLLKHIAEDLAPFLTHLINSSITSGVVPRSMKHAIVTPLLKKANLDPDNMTNYRPISNLSFASKLLERHVARCLLDHATTNDLLDRNQSAYRPHHSTETALVLVQNDILKALDQRHGVILILLDMSAAFDTVDHDVLVTRLEQRFGVTGCAIAWIKSYLSDRSQSVKIHGSVSDDTPLVFGVPQGSALGPILFTMYTTPIGDIIRRHQLNFHLYADDTQLYVNFELSDDDNKLSSLNKIENCVSEVRMWMNTNFLKLNEDKTVALVHASRNNQTKHNITAIKIGDCDITPSPSARNIGVVFDGEMSMAAHVHQTCRVCYYHLKNIASIRSCLTEQAAIRLVHSLVVSRLDYANALLFGITDVLIGKLQRVQNYAARLVVRCGRRDHITPVLKKLHWLPVKQRVTYKIILLTFRALNGLAPIYIVDMLHRHRPTRALRSADNNDLQVPSTSSRYGDRAFAASAPRLWNALPRELKIATSLTSFKRLLKTHLFRIAYEQ